MNPDVFQRLIADIKKTPVLTEDQQSILLNLILEKISKNELVSCLKYLVGQLN